MGSSSKKGSPAPAPDYQALAAAQGTADKNAAQYNTNANRVNQVGPNGSVTWSMRPGANPNNPQAGDYTQTTSLSAAQQGLQNSSDRISQQYANTAEQGLGRVQAGLGKDFDTSGYAPMQNSINAQGLPELGGDYEASRKAVEDAYMARASKSLDQNQSATENKLLNSGIEKGSEAWNREMQNLNEQRNDAQSQAILAGGQEQSRLHGLAASDRGQLYGEATNNAQFGNQARSQGIEEGAYLRSLPLNEVNALRSGAQVTSPQFSQYYTGGSTQASPIFDAGVAQGNYATQANASRQSGNNALLGGLTTLGAAWLGS